MNGIIHGCSHNNSGNFEDDDGEGFDTVSRISNPEIFQNVCYYLDRVIGDMVQPTELVYMAIDGVAPRAKLNQQRSRRYRSGTEGEIETNIYDAHAQAVKEQQMEMEETKANDDHDNAFDLFENGYSFIMDEESAGDKKQQQQKNKNGNDALDVKEVAPGRFTGKFETHTQDLDSDKETFHSNVITPGTPFFQEFTKHLEHFVKYKINNDPKWKNLTIVFSGPNVPGEGEHKIMQFIREQKQSKNYNPNLRHCIMGQDGDLIMLGLATHEPNLVLLRERVLFNMTKQRLSRAASAGSLDSYIQNPHFEFLHMEVLRGYLAYEFETANVLPESPWDLEHVIDDFVFMTFFVGNDFLPHMPALDIADNAFDLLFWTYKECRKKWIEDDPSMPYLTNRGSIVSGKRLEEFCTAIGSHEVAYYDKKKHSAVKENRRLRKEYKKFGLESNIPHENMVASKEDFDREAYRKMLQQAGEPKSTKEDALFSPVMTSEVKFQPSTEVLEEGLVSRMGDLLQNSISNDETGDKPIDRQLSLVDDQDLKGRYYYDKFQFSPYDQDKHLALRKAYIEGLVWNLKYYYEGCVSWEWFYPYHYGPMLSDLVSLDTLLAQVDFEGKLGSPLKPFQQLMGCMPPSQAHHLPEPYRWLMTEPSSPIIDFYPKTFTIDMNGKRWPWEAVALLPFLDSKRLLDAMENIDDSLLTEEERQRNSTGNAVVMMYDPGHSEFVEAIGSSEGFQLIEDSKVISIPFGISDWNYGSEQKAILEPCLHPETEVPLPGFSSLLHAPVQSLWRRKNGINVFGSRSRYKTSCLELSTFMPLLPPIESLAPKLIGTSIYINYPHFVEGLVTAVSDEKTVVRGKNKPRRWTEKESEKWKVQRDGIARRFETGEGYTGTGGIIIPDDQMMTLSVRPLQGLVTTKEGAKVKSYANFEIEVPMISTFWNPTKPDPRLIGVPSRLEKRAFDIATPLKSNPPNYKSKVPKSRRNKLFPPRGTTSRVEESSESRNVAKAFYSNSSVANRSARGRETWKRSYSYLTNGVRLDTRIPVETKNHVAIGVRGINSYSQMLDTMNARGTANKARGPRGRALAIGLIAASFLVNVSGAVTSSASFGVANLRERFTFRMGINSSQLSSHTKRSLKLSGGDFETGEETKNGAPPLEFAHGTTTISFIFKGGIIAAVDSRASLGSFVGSKTTKKVLPVNSHILGTMAGGAADCMFWIRKLKAEAMLHELSEGCKMSVARASRLLSNALYDNRGLELSVGTMIMGFDSEDGPPKIFYVDNTGVRIEGDLFAVGSGGTFALGILDNERQRMSEMTEDEAIQLGIKAIRHATFRDAYSGGFINVYLISREGWKKVFTEDLASIPDAENAIEKKL